MQKVIQPFEREMNSLQNCQSIILKYKNWAGILVVENIDYFVCFLSVYQPILWCYTNYWYVIMS